MKVIKVEAELTEGRPFMAPEGKEIEVTRRDKEGNVVSVEVYPGIKTYAQTGRYILTYENGTTEIVDQERAEQERRALLGSFAQARAEAIRQAQQGA